MKERLTPPIQAEARSQALSLSLPYKWNELNYWSYHPPLPRGLCRKLDCQYIGQNTKWHCCAIHEPPSCGLIAETQCPFYVFLQNQPCSFVATYVGFLKSWLIPSLYIYLFFPLVIFLAFFNFYLIPQIIIGCSLNNVRLSQLIMMYLLQCFIVYAFYTCGFLKELFFRLFFKNMQSSCFLLNHSCSPDMHYGDFRHFSFFLFLLEDILQYGCVCRSLVN